MAFDLNTANHSNRSLIVACVLAAVLHILIAPQFALFGGRINFMLALAVAFAVGGDPRIAVYVGFGSGLFYDLTSQAPIGLMALLLTLASFALASLSRGVTPGMSGDALRLTIPACVLVNLVYALALFFMGFEGSLLIGLGSHGLMSGVLTSVGCVPFMLLNGGTASRSRGFSGGKGRMGGTRFKGIR